MTSGFEISKKLYDALGFPTELQCTEFTIKCNFTGNLPQVKATFLCLVDSGVENKVVECIEEFELTEKSQWFPISIAPKNGTEILVKNSSGTQRVVKWDDISTSGEKGWQIAVIATDFNYYEELRDVVSWKPLR